MPNGGFFESDYAQKVAHPLSKIPSMLKKNTLFHTVILPKNSPNADGTLLSAISCIACGLFFPAIALPKHSLSDIQHPTKLVVAGLPLPREYENFRISKKDN